MNWDYWKGLFFEYWYYAMFSLLVAAVVSISFYYIQVQFQDRKERLRDVHLYRMDPRDKAPPEVAGLEPVINNVLFPRPNVYLPLIDQLTLKVNWGPNVRNWSLRPEPLPPQEAPYLRGPP